MSIFDLFGKKKPAEKAAKPQRVRIDDHWYNVCENCGTPVDGYGRLNNRACNLCGKLLCPSCFKKLSKTTTVVCKECGKTISYLESKSKLCPECWLNRLSKLREFHGEYHARLSASLSEKGISVLPASTEYVDESGRATLPIVPSATNCTPLRKDVRGYCDGDECAVFTVKVKGTVFALPDNGIGIRYIKAGTDSPFTDHACSLEKGCILALASDGKDLFVLNDRGDVLSTKKDWEVYPLFDVMDEVREITARYFDESEISEAVRQYEQGTSNISSSVTSKISYDCTQNAFIKCHYSGNSHEGVESIYSEMSREDVLRQLTKYHFNLREIVFSAQNGTVPLISIVERLAVHDSDTKINLPESERVY